MANILEQYQLFQKETSIKNYNLTYLALGLGGEIGEVQNEIKKLERDNNNILTVKKREQIILELGDAMWYFTGICNKLDCSLEDVLRQNIHKFIVSKFIF